MRQSITLFLVVFFVFILFGFFYSFAQERITLTTYYPAPYGVYRELRTDQIAIGSAYRNVNLVDGQLLVNGSVGIGTANPTYNLEVNGSMSTKYIDAGDLVGGAYNLNFGIPGSSWAVIGNYPSEIPPAVGFYTLGLTTDLRIWASGNDVYMPNSRLGVGDKSPDSTLYVYGSESDSTTTDSVGLVKLKSPTSATALKIGIDDLVTTDAGWVNVYQGNLYLQRAGGNITIGSPIAGMVGIGTDSPSARLDVAGGVKIAENLTVVGSVTAGGYSASGAAVYEGSVHRGAGQPDYARIGDPIILHAWFGAQQGPDQAPGNYITCPAGKYVCGVRFRDFDCDQAAGNCVSLDLKCC